MKATMRLCALVLVCAATAAAQSSTLAPGDNLVVDGVGKIPMTVVEDVGRYTNFRGAGLASWHPVKREMLISTRFGDTSQVHWVKMPSGDRRQMTFYDDPVSGVSFDRKTGEYFIFGKGTGGNEITQGYRFDVANGAVTMLTDGKSRHSGALFSNNSGRFLYGRIRPTAEGPYLELRQMDATDPKSDRLVSDQKGAGWGVMNWSPDDTKVLVGEFISVNESYLWVLDVASGEKTLLTPKGGAEKVAYNNGRFSRDAKGIYFTTDKDSEFRRLCWMDLATKDVQVLSGHIPWDVDSVVLSPNGKLLAFVTNEDGIGVLHMLDTTTGKERPVPKLPLGNIFGMSWHMNSRDLGLTISSARSATDVYSLDVQTGKVERWTYSETSGLNPDSFSEPELVKWKSFDGRMISGFLYRPPAKFSGKRPVIVNIHGGPESQYQPGFLGRNNYYMNELGVALLFPNIRGSYGYGKTFLKLDNGMLREDSYKDIAALLDWIKQQPGLDSERIMVTGGSYGGHMTLAISTFYADRIRCALDVVGPSNLRTFLENTEAFRRDLRRVEYGDERDPKMREFLDRIAPLTNVNKITKPLFVVQGRNDPRVPLSESEQIVAALKKNNTRVWYLMAKDEGHGFAKKKNQDFQFYATVLFIQEHLLK